MEYTVSQARAVLPELLRHVEAGGEAIITRHGRPVAVVVSPVAVELRRAREAINEARTLEALLDGDGLTDDSPRRVVGLTDERAGELVSAIRAGRDAR